jgi:RsmE family RNA methyltransferase
MNIILFDKLDKLNTLSIKDERARHIKKILKLKVSDSFLAGVINSVKGLATILEINDENIIFSFEADSTEEDKLHPLTLIMAFVRPICMKRILREAVSLGVEKIILSGADLTEKSYSKANFYVKEEYKKVLVDGAMQAAQTSISEVVIVDNIRDAIVKFDNSYDKLLLDNVLKGKSLSDYIPRNKKSVIAIGPERGFSQRERNLFVANDFNSYTIGTRVLRSETASCAAIALTLSKMNLI